MPKCFGGELSALNIAQIKELEYDISLFSNYVLEIVLVNLALFASFMEVCLYLDPLNHIRTNGKSTRQEAHMALDKSYKFALPRMLYRF